MITRMKVMLLLAVMAVQKHRLPTASKNEQRAKLQVHKGKRCRRQLKYVHGCIATLAMKNALVPPKGANLRAVEVVVQLRFRA